MDQRQSGSCISITFIWIAVIFVILNNHSSNQEINSPPIDLITPVNQVIKAYESLGLVGVLFLVLIFIAIEVKLYQRRMYALMTCLAMLSVGLIMLQFMGYDMRLMPPIFRGINFGMNMTGH